MLGVALPHFMAHTHANHKGCGYELLCASQHRYSVSFIDQNVIVYHLTPRFRLGAKHLMLSSTPVPRTCGLLAPAVLVVSRPAPSTTHKSQALSSWEINVSP
jgi:hypothetical protein